MATMDEGRHHPGHDLPGPTLATGHGARAHAADSPALLGRTSGEAREIKFRVPAARLDELSNLLAHHLDRDPHGDPALGGDYRVASLYCDTADLEVFRRIGWHRFRKFRIRRYGASSQVFLERKTRLADLVRKDRVAVSLDELRHLGSPCKTCIWTGSDFHRQIERRGLRPACFVEYRRRAFFGGPEQSGGPRALRVTIDREVRGAPAAGWSFSPATKPAPLLLQPTGELMVLEIKFSSGSTTASGVPVSVKRLIADLNLCERGMSKYRQCTRHLLGLSSPADSSGAESGTEAEDA
ncbi:MAG: polyphosphate polymerase domain-containing protein [Phycisphaerae bacterium]|jgi:hypothetical protein|nr:polyphosphate polymerase domain-containing protein [Phycisphaerae bacterium]